MQTGYMFLLVTGTQLRVGVRLVLNRFVPLALIAPIHRRDYHVPRLPGTRSDRSGDRRRDPGGVFGLGVPECVPPHARRSGRACSLKTGPRGNAHHCPPPCSDSQLGGEVRRALTGGRSRSTLAPQ